jgi:hypothetical protein
LCALCTERTEGVSALVIVLRDNPNNQYGKNWKMGDMSDFETGKIFGARLAGVRYPAAFLCALREFLYYKKILELQWKLDIEIHIEYIRELKIIPLRSQYMYSLSLLVIKNKNHFITNSEIHNTNTRIKTDLRHS